MSAPVQQPMLMVNVAAERGVTAGQFVVASTFGVTGFSANTVKQVISFPGVGVNT